MIKLDPEREVRISSSSLQGTLTFLYTDIEGSTRLWEQQPDLMRLAVIRQDEILRQAIAVQKGKVFRTVGDALCAAFANADLAVAAAVTAQRELYAEPWSLSEPLRVRTVLHSGAAEFRQGDYVGASLNLLGRLLDVCYGGQVLVSQATAELARGNLPLGVSLLDLGEHHFRDLARPERVFQLVIPDLPERFPPLRSLGALSNNLPVQLTSFVGRQRELAEIRQKLTSIHLLTLTGPGGTGKTRLGLQAAAVLLYEGEIFPDGVWLVELAPISNPALILPGISAALGLYAPPLRTLKDVVIDFLRLKTLLLILDNCEHLIEACAVLAQELLQACPGLKILASSREPLGISGEVIVRVPSLDLPIADPLPPLTELAQHEAIQLFTERAAAVQPDFYLNEQNAPAVVQICRRLDGIPLAIELAAARVRMFTPEQIASRLDDRFRLLTGGSRSAMPRQQTLRALIDWSYDLLSPAECTLLRRLSVFSGGWTYEAAEAVCTGNLEGDFPLDPLDMLDLLEQLVNKSLVIVEAQGNAARYRLLETIRQYAQEKLLQAGETATIRSRHLEYFEGFAAQAAKGLVGNDQVEWFGRLQAEYDNLRPALEWALDHDPAKTLRITGDVSLFLSRAGFGVEGRRWIKDALARLEARHASYTETEVLQARARGLHAYGVIALAQGDRVDAARALNESNRVLRDLGDLQRLAEGLALYALASMFDGDMEPSRAAAQEAYSLGQQNHNLVSQAISLTVLARYTISEKGDIAEAQAKLAESLDLMRVAGNQWFAATVMASIGLMALFIRDYRLAQFQFEQSLGVFQAIGDKHFYNISRSGLAEVARMSGDYSRAIPLFQQTLLTWRDLGNRGAMARCLECLAFIAIAQAQKDPGRQRSSYLLRATTLLGAADAIRSQGGSSMELGERQEYDQQIAILRAVAGEDLFTSGWQAGRALDLDQALDFAVYDPSIENQNTPENRIPAPTSKPPRAARLQDPGR